MKVFHRRLDLLLGCCVVGAPKSPPPGAGAGDPNPPGAGDAADGVDAKRGHRASRASRGSNLRELEALAGSVAGGRGAAGSVAGAERFAAIEKELQALASRAGVGDGSPLSALVDPESSDEEETPVTK